MRNAIKHFFIRLDKNCKLKKLRAIGLELQTVISRMTLLNDQRPIE